MFLIEGENRDTIVVTKKAIYKINYQKLKLEPLYNFNEDTDKFYYVQDGEQTMILTENELLILNSKTLDIVNRLPLNAVAQDSSRLKQGTRRFYFVSSI